MSHRNLYNNYCCPQVFAISPVSAPGARQGEIGLTGPNAQLLMFNSGDPTSADVLVLLNGAIGSAIAAGLGVAEPSSDLTLSELGTVLNTAGRLETCEFAYTIGGASDVLAVRPPNSLRFDLIAMRSDNNNGDDYPVPAAEVLFTETLPKSAPLSGSVSANKLGIPVVGADFTRLAGDRIVLRVTRVAGVGSMGTSIGVSCSVQLIVGGV